MKKFVLAAFAALVLPTTAFAQEPAPTPEKKCCCCDKKEHEKGCCDEKKGHDTHESHAPTKH